MAIDMRHILGMVSLVALLAGTSAGLAQTGRTWIDPPSEGGQPQTSVPASEQPSRPTHSDSTKPLSASPEQASSGMEKAPGSQVSQSGKGSDDGRPQPSAVSPQQKATAKLQTPRRNAVERKTRVSSQEATSVRTVQQKTLTARRGSVTSTGSIRASGMENRIGPRFKTVQEGIDSGLEVMRLRTIEFPDGRRITILTRPEPGAVSEVASPY